MVTPIFDQAHPKITESVFSFPEFAPACKNHFIPSIHSWEKDNFRVLRPDWPRLFFTIPNQNCFDQPLIYANLYNHAKNQAYVDLFWWYGWLKILQSDWLRTFWPKSQEQNFSHIWDLSRNNANSLNFHYRTNSVKIFNKFKDPCFWPIFGSFSQKLFFQKFWLCHAQPQMGL